MADLRPRTAPSSILVAFSAIAATLGGWMTLAVHDAPAASAASPDAPSLAPLPTLEPIAAAPPSPPRRPAPIATTRSSR